MRIFNEEEKYMVHEIDYKIHGIMRFEDMKLLPKTLREKLVDRLGIQNVVVQIDFEEGDSVVVTGGVWKDTVRLPEKIIW